jgi:hypothetical protein
MNWIQRRRLASKIRRATLGRSAEKERYSPFLPDPTQRSWVFDVIDLTYDLIEGRALPEQLTEAVLQVFLSGDARAWQNTAEWLEKTTAHLPEMDDVWLGLARHPDWQIRWRIACLLYSTVPEPVSNRIFSTLRYDRSRKVRDYAIERYEMRAVPDGQLWCSKKVFDASGFDHRVERGDIRF